MNLLLFIKYTERGDIDRTEIYGSITRLMEDEDLKQDNRKIPVRRVYTTFKEQNGYLEGDLFTLQRKTIKKSLKRR